MGKAELEVPGDGTRGWDVVVGGLQVAVIPKLDVRVQLLDGMRMAVASILFRLSIRKYC